MVQLRVPADILLRFTTRTHTYDPTEEQTDLNVTNADVADIKSRVQV